MRFVTQTIIMLIVLAVGGVALLRLMPGSAEFAAKIGLPRPLIAYVTGQADVVADKSLDSGKKPGRDQNKRGQFNGPPVVVVKAASIGKVNDRLNAIGDGNAIRSVTVTPFVSGQIAEVLVTAGSKVNEGDIIARLDDDAEKIALALAKVQLASAENNLKRNENLKTIISGADLQAAQSAVDTARLTLAQAELNLARRAVHSPVTGIAGIVTVTPGDYVTSSTGIVTIDDRSRLLVDFWVPERFSAELHEGLVVEARAVARPGSLYEGKISAIDNRIDAASRTLHVQAQIPNDRDELRAGQSFEVTLKLPGEVWPSVDPLAIQWDSSGSFIWRIKNNKSERVSAGIIERNPENVLVDADIAPGDLIATEGLQRLKDGGEVKIYGADKVAEGNG
jgi:RND family efflux transporter MFP subunit